MVASLSSTLPLSLPPSLCYTHSYCVAATGTALAVVRRPVRVYVCVCVLVTLIALIERLFYACHAHLFVY